MPHTQQKSFHSQSLSFSNKISFDVGNALMEFQRNSEKVIKKRIRNKNFVRVESWIEKNTTRQFLT